MKKTRCGFHGYPEGEGGVVFSTCWLDARQVALHEVVLRLGNCSRVRKVEDCFGDLFRLGRSSGVQQHGKEDKIPSCYVRIEVVDHYGASSAVAFREPVDRLDKVSKVARGCSSRSGRPSDPESRTKVVGAHRKSTMKSPGSWRPSSLRSTTS